MRDLRRTDWERLSRAERVLLECAFGRIFRMGSRPEQPGDVAEYERCRELIFRVLEESGALEAQ